MTQQVSVIFVALNNTEPTAIPIEARIGGLSTAMHDDNDDIL